MRNGYTTGSCAAAAAKAATYMLFTHSKMEKVSIITPKGISYEPEIEKIELTRDYASCGIKKDSGDDPDITNGIYICARVSMIDKTTDKVIIKGGEGVGIVTRPGLEMPVGEYAINSVPRKMIISEVESLIELFDYEGSLEVEIFVPEGAIVAQKTFNPHMGIEGGISILGTSGIVEPMSNEAIIRTIELDLAQKKAEGCEEAIMVPGNYGADFLTKNYGLDSKTIVHFSNFIGVAIDRAVELGFDSILIAGHTGKLVKVSGGIMNTHSKEADCRMELMLAATLEAANTLGRKVDNDFMTKILNQVTTTAVLEILEEEGMLSEVSKVLLDKIMYHLRKRAGQDINIRVILYENSFGLLAKSFTGENIL